MANETNISAQLTCTKSGQTVSGSGNLPITMAGDQPFSNVQPIGTSTEVIDLGSVSTIGYLWLKNQDDTNFVQIDLATPVTSGSAFCKLLPGEFCMVPTRQTTIYALADTAEVNLAVVAVEL